MIAFITGKSNLVPLLESLCSSNPCRFDLSFFVWVFAGIEPTSLGWTFTRSDQLSLFYSVADGKTGKTSKKTNPKNNPYKKKISGSARTSQGNFWLNSPALRLKAGGVRGLPRASALGLQLVLGSREKVFPWKDLSSKSQRRTLPGKWPLNGAICVRAGSHFLVNIYNYIQTYKYINIHSYEYVNLLNIHTCISYTYMLIDWCCFYYFVRKPESLVALRDVSECGYMCTCSRIFYSHEKSNFLCKNREKNLCLAPSPPGAETMSETMFPVVLAGIPINVHIAQ